MPFLGDYLGHLLAEIAMARMKGDLETVRIAELYAAHPLLRTMPVPHVRTPEIDLEIPMLIDGGDVPSPGTPAKAPSPQELRARFDQVLSAHLARSGITLTDPERSRLA